MAAALSRVAAGVGEGVVGRNSGLALAVGGCRDLGCGGHVMGESKEDFSGEPTSEDAVELHQPSTAFLRPGWF